MNRNPPPPAFLRPLRIARIPVKLLLRVSRGGNGTATLTGKDIDLNRSQGRIGLFIPDFGYPFGEIPDWLIRQRIRRPDWYRDVWPLGLKP